MLKQNTHPIITSLLVGYLAILSLILSSCYDNNNPTPANADSTVVVATPNPSDIITSIGAYQDIRISYQTKQGSASNLHTNLNNLPEDWQVVSIPKQVKDKQFDCSLITIDSSGCLLILRYTPTKLESNQVLSLPYTYISSNGKLKQDITKLQYNSQSDGSNVIYTANPDGIINTSKNTPAIVTLTFNTDESQATATGLQINGVASLSPEWTTFGPLTCKKVTNSGMGCSIVLQFTPKVESDSGNINLTYTYLSNHNIKKTNGISLFYNVTNTNTVVATYPPVVSLTYGQTQDVIVNFKTSNRQSITNLNMNLSSLATKFPGWSSESDSFSCADVSNNCYSLILDYAPKTSDNITQGYLNLPYTYTDHSGKSKQGSVVIWYSAHNKLSDDSLTPIADPMGTITTTLNNLKPVTITFASTPRITEFNITSGLDNLSKINPGWFNYTPKFSCAAISFSQYNCTLKLYYKPTSLVDYGSLVLNYSYLNTKGKLIKNSYIINYHPETDNHVTAILESDTIRGIINTSSKLNYSFITNDGLPASKLSASITPDENLKGIISGNTLNCPVLSGSEGICTNTLIYTANELESGKFTLKYTYTNGNGQIESATQLIKYFNESSNQIKVTAISQDQTPLSNMFPLEATINQSAIVNITFTTYDGSMATDFKISLDKLPTSSWQLESGSNYCASVTNANSCKIALKYSPSSIESGIIKLSYSYITSSGISKNSPLDIPYQSFKAWHKITSYSLGQGTANMWVYSNLSSLLFNQNKELTFLLNNITFQLQGNSLVTQGEGWSGKSQAITSQLIATKQGDLYRLRNYHTIYSNDFMVQHFANQTWNLIGESTPVGDNIQLPGFALDNNNSIYFSHNNQIFKYSASLGSWYPLTATAIQEFTTSGGITAPKINTVSLAFDNNNTLFAGYDVYMRQGLITPFHLYKYTGTLWQNISTPNISRLKSGGTLSGGLYNTAPSIVFDHNNNLYLLAVDIDTQKNLVLRYDGTSWVSLGDIQTILNPQDLSTATSLQSPKLIIDSHDNLYVVINNGYLRVYKYTNATKKWTSIGQRNFNYNDVDQHSLDYNIYSNIGLSPDETKLYVAAIVAKGTTAPEATSLNLYSYDLN